MRRAREALESADIVLLVEDLSRPDKEHGTLAKELPEHASFIRVGNKADLVDDTEDSPTSAQESPDSIRISAKTGQGVDELRRCIREAVGASARSEGSVSARQRHVDALKRASRHLENGQRVMEESGSGELLAEELRLAQSALGEITGEMLPDDLLGEIFSSFCIGK